MAAIERQEMAVDARWCGVVRCGWRVGTTLPLRDSPSPIFRTVWLSFENVRTVAVREAGLAAALQ